LVYTEGLAEISVTTGILGENNLKTYSSSGVTSIIGF
jgi:hypothetical protein